jgi:hypothetical protein
MIVTKYSDTVPAGLRLILASQPAALGTSLPSERKAGGEEFRHYILQSSVRGKRRELNRKYSDLHGKPLDKV